VRDINNLLEKTLEQNAFVRYHDVTSCLTLPDGSGKIDASCFREGLHPNEKGYASLLKAYKKILFK
jgi:lysophospholipase L1-like esterase